MYETNVIDGNFKLLSKLGSGSFSSVYVAKNLQDNKLYCLKIFNENSRQQDQQNQAQIGISLSKLDNFNILKALDYSSGFIQTNNLYYRCRYLVTQYLGQQSGTVEELLQCFGNSLSIDSTGIIFEQILSGISELHKLGISHRDIKPANILLYKSKIGWNIKIIDFNSAKNENKNQFEIEKYINLTQHYCPPQHFSQNNIEWQSYKKYDVFAAGATFLQLLTNKSIFSYAKKTDNVYKNILQQKILKFFVIFNSILRQSKKQSSANLVKMIIMMLKPKPNQRWSIQNIKNCEWMKKTAFKRQVFNQQMEKFNNFFIEKKVKLHFEQW